MPVPGPNPKDAVPLRSEDLAERAAFHAKQNTG